MHRRTAVAPQRRLLLLVTLGKARAANWAQTTGPLKQNVAVPRRVTLNR